MIPVVAVVGTKNAGKTTLAGRLVTALKERGLRIGYLKHAHEGFEHDVPGKDSWRMREAGAQAIALVGGGRHAADGTDIEDPRVLANRLFGCDLVIAEGFSDSAWPKIRLRHADGETREVEPPVIVTLDTTSDGQVGDDDFTSLVDRMEQMVFDAPRESVAVEADGQWVELEGFAATIVRRTALGMLSTLKGVDESSTEITLRIRRRS